MTTQQEIYAEIERIGTISASSDSGLVTALQRIAGLAGKSYPQVAEIAASLLREISDENSGPPDQVVKSGLGLLQEAMQSFTEEGPAETAASGLADDPELIHDFVVESREHISSIETNLLALEKNALLLDAVHGVFRSFHTIKGLAGFLAFGPLQEVAHETETLLDHAREKRVEMTSHLIDVTLKAADYIRNGVDLLSSRPVHEAMQSLPPWQDLRDEIASASERALAGGCAEPSTDNATTAGPADTAPSGENPQENKAPGKKADATVVRVDTAKLEYLVEMVGELVIAQSMIEFVPGVERQNGEKRSRNFAHLARVTGEIQKTVLSMRMVQISRLYDKMARLVRDLARKSGKRIELRRIGDQVELDRNIVEEITDPIVHMIRNSVDHGIESVAERVAGGKSETACITLEAFHQAGYIILQMSDDGRGLNTRRIREKAIEKGLIAPAVVLDDRSLCRLIFEPGFSTAERVTDISGRGVGMDVVRRQIEKLRGTIEVASVPGQGCTIMLKLPLTLAMVDGLIVEAGGEKYILPIYSVREMFHVTEDKLFTIEEKAEMALLRGALVPVVRLDRFFGRGGHQAGGSPIGIVVEGRTRQFCLIVDRMVGKQEVVIKTLGPCFKGLPGVAGGAILGDGHVGLILDVHGIDGGEANDS
jgi:two-component system chemotaxis sensor kinase CheA